MAGQAAGPLEKPNALQNCPRLYQGESGGLEPSTKPVAGQAAAPLRFLSPLRGPGASPVNLWPLSFDQESGDMGVGLLPDKLSNHKYFPWHKVKNVLTIQAEQKIESSVTLQKSASLRSRKTKVFQPRRDTEKEGAGLRPPKSGA